MFLVKKRPRHFGVQLDAYAKVTGFSHRVFVKKWPRHLYMCARNFCALFFKGTNRDFVQYTYVYSYICHFQKVVILCTFCDIIYWMHRIYMRIYDVCIQFMVYASKYAQLDAWMHNWMHGCTTGCMDAQLDACVINRIR